jgi:hypothetical protein
MNPAMIAGAVRTVIAMASGALVAGGYMDQDAAAGASANVEAIVGGLGGLITLGWSVWAKMHPTPPAA